MGPLGISAGRDASQEPSPPPSRGPRASSSLGMNQQLREKENLSCVSAPLGLREGERGGEREGELGRPRPTSRHPAPAARKRPRRIPLKGTALLVGGLGGRQEPPEDADIKLDAVFMTNTCDLLLHNRSPQALAGKCGAPFLLCRFFM